MASTLRRIGIYGDSLVEIANRPFAGAVSYVEEVGGFTVRDFRTRGDPGTLCGTRPPWKNQIDGVIVCVGRDEGKTDSDMADWVLSGGVPAVAVGSDWIDPRVPCVYVNSHSLADLAAEHLIKCGCRSFLYIGFAGAAGSLKRGRAFKESLAQRGRKPTGCATSYRLLGSPADQASLREETSVVDYLRKMKKPLGVWALNDNFAAALCDVCRELGIAIPEQVKVLGVDDMAIARSHRPTLSSIRTPGEESGRRAMRTLHQWLDGRARPHGPIQIPAVQLLGRETTLGRTASRVELTSALDYIAQHACAGLTVRHLAETLDISRRSLELQFRSLAGRSPQDEIQRVKLKRAEELLRRTELSVSRIASMVGFAETAAFSKFFRNQLGVSPRDYRHHQVEKGKQR